MKYEFMIFTQDGNSVWHWDLKQHERVASDYLEVSDDDTSRVEIQRWFGEGDFDYVEVYPNNETAELPKYVQKYTDKVLERLNYFIGEKNEI
jgi:hypothetical protein